MLEIKIQVSDIDYDRLAEMLIPQISEAFMHKHGLLGRVIGNSGVLEKSMCRYFSRKTEKQKEEILEKLLNENHELLKEKLMELANEENINLQVKHLAFTSL